VLHDFAHALPVAFTIIRAQLFALTDIGQAPDKDVRPATVLDLPKSDVRVSSVLFARGQITEGIDPDIIDVPEYSTTQMIRNRPC
jgi:hypothetical protein